MTSRSLLWCLITLACGFASAQAAAPEFATDVLPLFRKYCNGCHNSREQAAGLVLEDFARALKGGEEGAVIKPGDSAHSRLWLVVSGQAEPKMPPEDAPQLKPEELKVIQAWIDGGATAPAGGPARQGLVTPKIAPTVTPREPVTALSVDPQGRWLAIARPNVVEIVSLPDQKPVASLTGHTGSIADVRFALQGDRLVVAAGEAGIAGEATIWQTSDWSRVRTLTGHRDSLYGATFSPDGQTLATASYDRDANLWNIATGEDLGEVSGHNDAVYAIAFHPNGKWLATASGDRTVKLWDAATRERLDTFSQPAKEQYTVSISPDGRYVAAGGVDNRVRVWEFGPTAAEGTNEIRYARFAHEAPILRVLFSPDGKLLVSCSEERRVKVWETRTFTQVALLERQSDWPSAVAFTPDSRTLWIGRMDGSLQAYPVSPKWADSTSNLVPLEIEADDVAQTEVKPPANVTEAEPNDQAEQAQAITLPAVVSGVLQTASGDADTDLFRFTSKAGEIWILETNAARKKSPADTKLEILHADGTPVRRALLQAVRDSWINFRPIDSSQLQVRVEFWEEMDINQFLYMNGEIGRFHRAPRGPDSGYDFYDNRGKRRTYFDTTPITHAKDELVYVVEAFPPDAPLVDNGLPVFPLNYVNDDDGERELGSDSRLTFTAPADGDYLVRVTDARGFSGKEFQYELTARPLRPDFNVVLDTKSLKLPAENGQRVKFYVDRIDNFSGPIRIDVSNLPAGYQISGATVIEAGQLDAYSVLTASPEAAAAPKEAWNAVKIVATADIQGQDVAHDVASFNEVTLEKPASIKAVLIPDSAASTDPDGGLVITPGTTITAMIRLERNGYDGDVKFDVDNLPHGVIVDNIGLSGVLVRKNENERQIFLTARPWVPESTRLIYATAQQQEKVSTLAIPLHVRKPEKLAQSE